MEKLMESKKEDTLRLERLTADVNRRWVHPHTARTLAWILAGMAVFLFLVLGSLRRDVWMLLIIGIVVGSISLISWLALLWVSFKWKRQTMEALRRAVSESPRLLFETQKYGLVFFDLSGFFVERPDLAYQTHVGPYYLTTEIHYGQDHNLKVDSILTAMPDRPRSFFYELPASISPEEAKRVIEELSKALKQAHVEALRAP
jgi:hypothetical protein